MMRKLIAFDLAVALGSLVLFSGATATPPVGAPTPPLSTLHLPLTVYSAPTIKEFLAACKSDPGGCQSEVGSAVLDKMHYDGSSHICLTQVDYSDAVPKWLAAHPETAAMTVQDGIYAALQALYPC